MDSKRAFEIVLEMARELRETSKVEREDVEMEALEIAEDYMEYWRGKVEHARYRDERPSTGCDYGIGG